MKSEPVLPDISIAIVGAGARFPGGVTNLDTFDRLLRDGVDAIQEIPPDRWSTSAFASSSPGVPGKTYSRWGGFLPRIADFEPEAFGISAREAAVMDPQQRLLLEVVWEALEDAGIPLNELSGSRTGVFVGISTFDYSQLQSSPASKRSLQSFTALGTSLSIAANRLSYCLDLRGPSISVDTACSSSLVALDRAVRSLQSGECDLAIAGGVNALLLPDVFVSFCAASMLSPDGHCKAFDAAANGFVRAEGAGALVLRPATAARARRDRVHARILASGVNQDGRTAGLAMPNGEAQIQLLQEVYARSGIAPSAVTYVEAHGTGTAVGDPIEANAIGRVFSDGREASRPLIIGSVKTNIGHPEAASGIAGVLKAMLSVKHRIIYRNLHFHQPNPNISFDALKLRVPVQTEPWPDSDGRPAIAAVNSFGFGGTNAHVVIAQSTLEPDPDELHPGTRSAPIHLLPITARHETALRELAGAFRQRLLRGESADMTALCRTAAMRRMHYAHRLCVAGETPADLASRLQVFLDGEAAAGIHAGVVPAGRRPLVFVFSGQGPQHPGMGMELQRHEPVFRETVKRCDEAIASYLGWSVLDEIERPPESSRINETHIAQPALFTIQAGLAALWQSWGVVPSVVIGHSVGEVAAAWISGALDLDTACRVIAVRSSAMQKARSGGKMAAVAITPEDALERLRHLAGDVSLAAVNGPRQVTLSGEPSALDALAKELQRDEVWHQFLQVSHAFHSSAMDAAELPLRSGLRGLSSAKPRLRLISTVTGSDVRCGDLDTDYWWRNVRQPVLFEQAVRAVMRDAAPVFLEIGPHPVMSPSLKECARAEQAKIDVWPSLRRNAEAPFTIRGSAAALFTAGVPMDWNAVLPGSGEPVDLPPHPWRRERYWQVDPEIAAVLVPRRFHPLIGFRRTSAVGTWDQKLDPKAFPWLADHRIKGSTVLPGAAYVELMLAALADFRGLDAGATFCLNNVQFQRALFIAGDSGPAVQVTVSAEDHTIGIHSRSAKSDDASSSSWVRNAAADWSTSLTARPSPIDLEALRKRCSEPVSIDEAYQKFHDFGLEYGPLFRANRMLWKGSGEALARIGIDPSLAGDLNAWWWHPTVLDACFQVCCAALPRELLDVLKLPVGADHIRVWDRGGGEVWCHAEVRLGTEWAILADIHVYGGDGQPLAQILGFRLQRAAGAISAATRRGPQVYTTQWKPCPLEPHDVPVSASPVWIVFADSGGVADDVGSRIANRGMRVARVSRSTEFTGDEADGFYANPADPEHMVRILDSLAGVTKVGVLYFWSFDVSEPSEAADRFAEDSLVSMIAPLHLMRALAAQNRVDLGKFVLVTRNARKLHTDDPPCRANAAGALGLGRVAANEFPAWPIKLIDLPERPESEELDGLIDEVLSGDIETESAWRNTERFVPRLEEGPPADVYSLTASEVRAYRLVCQNSGSIDALKWVPKTRQTPGPDQVEIEVQHAAINFRDVLKCLGMYPADNPKDLVLGDECAGVITSTGADVTEFQVGDRVAGCTPGGFQSHVVARAAMLLRLAPHWDTGDAATIPIAFLTAWYSLRTVGRLARSESVLIHSAAGGVGLAAVQIAKAAGARIFATAGTTEKRSMLRDLGCELVMDSRSLTFSDEVRVHTEGRGVDVILNSLAGEALLQSVAILAPYGRFLEIGKRDLFANSRLGLWPLRLNASFHAIDLGAVLQEKPTLTEQLFSELRAAFQAGTLRPLPHSAWPASRVADAFRTMSQGKHIGKLVVDVRDPELKIISSDVPRVSFREDATYLVSGGLGGFGFETAKWIVRRGGRHVVLLSRRSPEVDAVQEALAVLRSIGAEPLAVQCDVGDGRQVREVLNELRLKRPPVRGVFHAAMVMDDAALLNLDTSRMHIVLEPKALGAWNLHAETQGLPLDHFVLFSSVSAAVGTPGQGSYAAANAILEGLAAYRRSLGLPATAIGWGFVSETGFAAQRVELMKRAEHHGFRGVPPSEYLDVLERLLPRECETAVVGDFDWGKMASSSLKARASRGLMTSLIGEPTDGRSGAIPGSRIREALETALPAERSALLRGYLQAQVARTLSVAVEKVDVERPIVELGLDSLMGIELATVIEQDCATTLPALATSRDVTVNRLVRDILEQMGYPRHDDRNVAVASAGNGAPFRLITPLRASGSRPALICFHPIGGSVRGYEPLTHALDASIPVFGVQSRMLGGEEEHASLHAMAAAYTAEVQTLWPDGPCWLFGYSLGGYLAASVAQSLESAGRTVEFVGVADCPDWSIRTSENTTDHLAKMIASSYQEAIGGLHFLKPLDDSDWSSFRSIAEKLTQHPDEGPAMMLAWLRAGRLTNTIPHQTLQAYLQRMARHLLLLETLPAMPLVEGPLFVWQASRGIGAGPDRWRRRHALLVRNTVVEADHAALMDAPAVQEIAREINLAYQSRTV